MPLDISSDAIIEKNKLTSDNAELLLIEINYEDEETIRICLNNDTVPWDGETWYPAIFSLQGMTETKDAEIPNITLNFVDIGNIFIPIIEEYAGCSGAEIIIRIVHSKYLSNTTPHLQETMEIISSSVDSKALVTINLGAENLANLRIPKQRYLKNNCRFKFKVGSFSFSSGGVLVPEVGNYIKDDASGNPGTCKIIKILGVANDGSFTWAAGTAKGVIQYLHIDGGLDWDTHWYPPDYIHLYSDEACTNLLQSDIAVWDSEPIGRCNYTGTETECNRSFSRCQELGNTIRFGGFPGVGSGGLMK